MSETLPFENGATVLKRLDESMGHHLVSFLRAPNGAITVAINGLAKRHFELSEEDWHTMQDRGYDIWTRTFSSEGELSIFIKEALSG